MLVKMELLKAVKIDIFVTVLVRTVLLALFLLLVGMMIKISLILFCCCPFLFLFCWWFLWCINFFYYLLQRPSLF